MTSSGRTKDESFMIRLYDEASKQSDIEEPIDRYVIGQMVGLHQKAIDTICNTLAQTNFIKKHGKTEISITDNGIRLVETLKSQAH